MPGRRDRQDAGPGGGAAADPRRATFGLTAREQVSPRRRRIPGGDIARGFSISVTVKHHLTNIFDKLGVEPPRLALAVHHHLETAPGQPANGGSERQMRRWPSLRRSPPAHRAVPNYRAALCPFTVIRRCQT
jgi:hypothetical protein